MKFTKIDNNINTESKIYYGNVIKDQLFRKLQENVNLTKLLKDQLLSYTNSYKIEVDKFKDLKIYKNYIELGTLEGNTITFEIHFDKRDIKTSITINKHKYFEIVNNTINYFYKEDKDYICTDFIYLDFFDLNDFSFISFSEKLYKNYDEYQDTIFVKAT
jgi:hypothetical protein